MDLIKKSLERISKIRQNFSVATEILLTLMQIINEASALAKVELLKYFTTLCT
jgi:hypothetical protein